MKINKRLMAIAELVDDGSNLIDVGCDHALLPIYVMEHKKNITAIASDKLPGPLEQAKKNIKAANLENKIKVQLSDGIKDLDDQTDTIVISGMGGQLMIGIFKYQMEKLKNIKTIILSPNNDQSMIRSFLLKHGFILVDEMMVEDAGHIYLGMKFQKGKKHYSRQELYFGPILLEKRGELFDKYYQKELERKRILIKLLPKKYRYRRFQVKNEITLLEKTLESK